MNTVLDFISDEPIFKYAGEDIEGKRIIVRSLKPNLVGESVTTIDEKTVKIYEQLFN